jgi:hypothetical protein
MKRLKEQLDFLWTPSYPGMLLLMWLCILLAIAILIKTTML